MRCRLRAEAGHHGGFQQRQLLYSRQLPRGLQRSGRAKWLYMQRRLHRFHHQDLGGSLLRRLLRCRGVPQEQSRREPGRRLHLRQGLQRQHQSHQRGSLLQRDLRQDLQSFHLSQRLAAQGGRCGGLHAQGVLRACGLPVRCLWQKCGRRVQVQEGFLWQDQCLQEQPLLQWVLQLSRLPGQLGGRQRARGLYLRSGLQRQHRGHTICTFLQGRMCRGGVSCQLGWKQRGQRLPLRGRLQRQHRQGLRGSVLHRFLHRREVPGPQQRHGSADGVQLQRGVLRHHHCNLGLALLQRRVQGGVLSTALGRNRLAQRMQMQGRLQGHHHSHGG
mmetsp:Transcript_57680/g.93827  ORF Transcript_57680/g.93827 Transcript_57680/m.93827 type:complete len:330 (+) Transcript_57680:532-1521(+)